MRHVPHGGAVKPPTSKVLLDRSNKAQAVVVHIDVLARVVMHLGGLRAGLGSIEPALAAELDLFAAAVLAAPERTYQVNSLAALEPPPATVAEAATVLGVSVRRVRQLIAAGTLMASRAPGERAWRIDRTCLAETAAQRQQSGGRGDAVATVDDVNTSRPRWAVPFGHAVISTHDLPFRPALNRHDAPADPAAAVDFRTVSGEEFRAEAARLGLTFHTTIPDPVPATGPDTDWATATYAQYRAEAARHGIRHPA